MKWLFLLLVFVSLVAPRPVDAAEDGKEILKLRCAACHDLKGPAPATIHQLWARDAPDLFYAGNKFRRQWLVDWLGMPVRIRPAGENYLRHIKPTSKYDILYGKVLRPLIHPRLTPAEANAVADELMKLKPHDDLLKGYKLDTSKQVTLDQGEVLFDKVYGCFSCHQIEPGFGGFTGPEVYTAGRRLQPAFMLSYITSPQHWDPKIWMPNGRVKPDDLQKIVNYLILLSKENFNVPGN